MLPIPFPIISKHQAVKFYPHFAIMKKMIYLKTKKSAYDDLASYVPGCKFLSNFKSRA